MIIKNLNKIFVGSLLLSFLLFGFLYANYLLSYKDMSSNLVGLHKGISMGTLQSGNFDQVSGILFNLKRLKEHVSISIVSMLELTTMKEMVLDTYIAQTENVLNDTSFIINDLKQNISLLESDMNNCQNEKSLYDKQFFQAIDLYNQNYMDESLKKSIEAEKCVGENRINMNSKIVLLDQFNYYYNFIKTKYDYLVTQRDIIIRNFDLIKGPLLDELVNTREVLNNLEN